MDQSSHRVLRFQRFALDLTRGCVRVAGQQIDLRPKAFEVLRYLAENAGRLISKDELCRAVWPSLFVSDDSLAQCISELRSKLADHDHRLIKTLPRRGYLLDAEPGETNSVERDGSSTDDPSRAPADATSTSVRGAVGLLRFPAGIRGWVVATTLVGVFLTVVVAAFGLSPSRFGNDRSAITLMRPTVVVLPFQNSGAGSEQDYFADGITEDLITTLSRRSRGMVIARSTAFTYASKKSIDAREVGRELGVRYVLEGAIHRSDEQVRVTARLVDAGTAASVWTESFDVDRRDLPALRDEIVARLARVLSIELANAEGVRSVRERRSHPDAVDFTFRAKALFYRTPKGGDLTEVRRLFREAVRLDQELTDAWVGLARTYLRNVRFSQTRERDLEEASDAVERALATDASNAAARLARGWVRYERGRIDQALLEFEYATQLDPGDPLARASIAAAHIMLGRPDNALRPLADAMRLSPMDPELSTWQLYLGVAYLHLGKDAEAIHWLSKSLALNPSDQFTQLFLASALALSDRETEAQTAIAELMRVRPGFSLGRFKALEPSNASEFRSQRERVYEGLRRAGLPD